MATYRTTTAFTTAPIDIRFSCPKCGNTGITQRKYFRLESTVGGRNLNAQTAEALSKTELNSNAKKQLLKAAEDMKRGLLILQDTPRPKQTQKAAVLKCLQCGSLQLPDAGCKRRTLTPRWIWIVQSVLVVVWLIVCFAILGQSPVKPIGLLYATCAWLVAAVVLIVLNRKNSDKAYANPAILEKQYHSVLNPSVYADFSPMALARYTSARSDEMRKIGAMRRTLAVWLWSL